jgi:hypothetical protein
VRPTSCCTFIGTASQTTDSRAIYKNDPLSLADLALGGFKTKDQDY